MIADLLENWKNHCPFCNADLPEGTADTLCPKCHRPIQRLAIDEAERWMPKKLGDFTIEKYVGRGGMGVVFRGHSAQGDPVAVKIAFGNFSRQLDNELSILQQASQLKTPHIASLRDIGTETVGMQSFRWVATRWIGPRTLSDIIHDDAVDTNQRIRILENIARGIHYLHENNIVHGDICPDNIMLTDENEPYLGDFGVARSLSAEDRKKTVISPSGGKPKYGAPEIWSGKEPSERSDIYSFGQIALEFLAKENDLSKAKFTDVHPPLEANLQTTLERCRQSDPADRPANMNEICAAFVSQGRREFASPRLIAVLCLLSLAIGWVLGSRIKITPVNPPISPPPVQIALPSPPENFKVEASEPNRLSLTWDAPAERPMGYTIQWRKLDEEKWNTDHVDADTLQFEIKKGIEPDTLYMVNLTSYNRAEEMRSTAVSETAAPLRRPMPLPCHDHRSRSG